MSLIDRYTRSREQILNRLLGIQSNRILNSIISSNEFSEDSSLAARIKAQLNLILALSLKEDGKVDYQNLAHSHVYQTFRGFVGELHNFDLRNLVTLEEKLTFWINLYNALVIDAVIQENIQNSVTESRLGILSFFQKAAYQVNGMRFSLTDIEHGLLRGNRGFPYFPAPHFGPSDPRNQAIIQPVDPRIHFALNCASNSCPPIDVYSPDKIHEQLNLASGNFINNDLIVDQDQKLISISSIFRWYQKDFGGENGIISTLVKFINDQESSQWLSKNQPAIKIQYHPYDWGLNKSLI